MEITRNKLEMRGTVCTQWATVHLRIFSQCSLESSATLGSSSMLKNEPVLKPQIALELQ